MSAGPCEDRLGLPGHNQLGSHRKVELGQEVALAFTEGSFSVLPGGRLIILLALRTESGGDADGHSQRTALTAVSRAGRSKSLIAPSARGVRVANLGGGASNQLQ